MRCLDEDWFEKHLRSVKEAKRKNWLWYSKKYNYLILLPDDPFKKVWDAIQTVLLLVIFILTPYWIAFTNED